MTSLFKKIAASIVGIAMAIGVGIGLSTNGVREARADSTTFTCNVEKTSSMTNTKDGISMAFESSGGTWDRTDNYRLYANKSLTVSSSNTITQIEFTISQGTLSLSSGGGSYSNGTWTGSSESIVFSCTAQVRFTPVVVTYTTGGGGGDTKTETTTTVTASNDKTTLDVTASPADKVQLSAAVSYDSGDVNNPTITWASDKTGVATVNASSGLVTAVAVGTARITATYAGDSTYSGSSGYIDIAVRTPGSIDFDFRALAASNNWVNGTAYSPVVVSSVTLTAFGGGNNAKYYTTDDSWRMYNGGSLTIAAPEGKEVTAVSSNPSQTFTISEGVASLSFSATVQFKTITVTIANLTTPVVGLDTDSLELTVGGSASSVTATPENITDPTYSWERTSGDDCVTLSGTNTATVSVSPKGSVLASCTLTLTVNGTKGGDAITPIVKTVSVTVDRTPTSGNPYSVAEARYAIDNNRTTEDAYTTGIVYQVDSYNETHHSITYWISDDGTSSNPLEVYGGLGIDDSTNQFTSKDDILVGDVVVVQGNLTKFSSTYEFAANNRLISLYRRTLSSITMSGTLTKSSYYDSQTFDPTGLTFTAVFNDATEKEIDNNDIIWPTLTAGMTSIQGSYTAGGVQKSTPSITISVAADTLSSIAVTGSMTKTSYDVGDGAWDPAGLIVTATYSSGTQNIVTNDVEWSYSPAFALGVTSVVATASYTDGVTKQASSSAQSVTVSNTPGVIDFGNTTGYWNPDSDSSTFTDTLGNTASISNDGAYSSAQAHQKQFGTGSSHATLVLITITLASRSGIESVSVKYKSAGSNTVELSVYGDTENDAIVSSSCTGNSNFVTTSTGNNYEKINADEINVSFAPTTGVIVESISYTLGSTVQELGTLDNITIKAESTHNTVFAVGQKFSTNGLVIIATDTVSFTKEFISGFTTDYDSYKTSAFAAGDKGTGKEVTVSLTIKGVTKTAKYTIDVIDPPAYSLAESGSALYEGMKVIIAYVNNGNVYAAGAQNGDYLSKVDGTLSGDDITFNADILEFTVEYYGSNILLKNNGHYLKHSASTKIAFTSTIDSGCVWSYNGSSLTSVNNSGYSLQYNSSSPRFTEYNTSQKSVQLFISSATPKDDTMGAATFAAKYLHMRDYTEADGSCKIGSANNYYSAAKTAYGSLSADEKTEFAKLSNAVARLQAWARANSETFDPSTGFGSLRTTPVVNMGDNSATIIIVVISMLSITALGGFFFLRKRKEEK